MDKDISKSFIGEFSMATKTAPQITKVNNGLLPTPPMPDGLPMANLTDNARQVLMKRYVRRGDDGKPAETVEGMFWRVASASPVPSGRSPRRILNVSSGRWRLNCKNLANQKSLPESLVTW